MSYRLPGNGSILCVNGALSNRRSWEATMKHTLPKKDFRWEHTRRNRFDVPAFSTKGAARFALSRPPANYRWQTHGEGRSFHQAPHSVHICRTPRGR